MIPNGVPSEIPDGAARVSSSSAKLLACALCAGIFLVYLLLPTRNYYWDGIGFAQTIEDAPRFDSSLIHPNHLLYTAMGYGEYKLAQAVGFHGRALTVLQVANNLWGALGAAVLFLILLDYECSRPLSALLTLLFAFSAAWWKYSTDANAYIPATLCLLLCFRLLHPTKRSRPWSVGVLHAAGMCLHQLSLIFFPVIVVGLWLQNVALDRRRFLACLQYGLTASLITTAAYALAYYAKQASGEVGSFSSWITSHSPEVGFSFDIVRDVVFTLRGSLQLFFGGRIVSVLRQPDAATLGLLSMLALLLASFIFSAVRIFRGTQTAWSRVARTNQQTLLLPALWIACYVAFLFFWLPWNTFYRLFYFPAAILLAGIILARASALKSKDAPRGLLLLVDTVAVFNLTFYILPNARIDSNPPLQMALRMNREWRPGTIVFYGTFVTDDWTARYFNPSTSWRPLPVGGLDNFNAALQEVRMSGVEVWLEATALDQILTLPGGAEWISTHAVGGSRRELVNTQHRIIFQRIS